jgi:hypothetical protein
MKRKIVSAVLATSLLFSGCASLPTDWAALMDGLCANYSIYQDRIAQARNILEQSRNLLISVLDEAQTPELKLVLVGGLTVVLAGLDQIITIANNKCLTEADVAAAQAVVANVEGNKLVRQAKMTAHKLKAARLK